MKLATPAAPPRPAAPPSMWDARTQIPASPMLSEAFPEVDGLFVEAGYREVPGYRFEHDAKPHRHERLAALLRRGPAALPQRHWSIQDVFDSGHVEQMLDLARAYGLTAVQFSGDNVYWVNDALHRYNTYVQVGRLCESCHQRRLKAYFWTHEINGFFHEFVRDGEYGFYGQLCGGKIDLSSRSAFWQRLREKYDVFFRRLPGVDGIVLTLNECQVPVFRDSCIDSDLDAAERVARIGRTVRDVCAAHGRHLILRTFCYSPAETQRIAEGVRRIGDGLTLMIKCVPHDWQTFYPHDPLIEQLKDYPRIIELDLAHEPMGAGRFPYPDIEHLAYRFEHLRGSGAVGAAGRIDRFRNHAHGTLNWANVFTFCRLALGVADPQTIWEEYAEADFGAAARDAVINLGRRLFKAGQQTYFLSGEWGSQHSNFNAFARLWETLGSTRADWLPHDRQAAQNVRLLRHPTPAFIEQIKADKARALADLERLGAQVQTYKTILEPADYEYLACVCERTQVIARAFAAQHLLMLMVRHDALLSPEQRRYAGRIDRLLAELDELLRTRRALLRDASNEGCQHNPEILEHFCRNVRRHLGQALQFSDDGFEGDIAGGVPPATSPWDDGREKGDIAGRAADCDVPLRSPGHRVEPDGI